jgi:hypothetical protein
MHRTPCLVFLLFNAAVNSVDVLQHDEREAATTTTTGNSTLFTSDSTSPITVTPNSKTGTAHTANHVTKTKLATRLPSPTTDVARLNLSTSIHNETLPGLTIDGHEIPISCRNCSLHGGLHVSGTGLSWNDNLIGDSGNLGFDGGIFKAQLPRGLKGHIELGIGAPKSLTHTFNLTRVPISGFVVPGLADAGVTLDVGVSIGLELEKPADVSFGFEFELTEHSLILIDVAEPNKSTVRGFGNDKGFTLNLLPVNVSEPGLDVKISTGLVLELAIGANMLHNDIAADMGARLAIPISIEERQLSNVDGKCNSLKNEASTRERLATGTKSSTTHKSPTIPRDISEQSLGNYTSIIPSIGVDMSVFVGAMLQDSLGLKSLGAHTDVQVFNTTLSRPTICINNHKAASATSVKSTATTTTNSHKQGTAKVDGQTHGLARPMSTTNATSGATRSSSHRESGDAFAWVGGSTVLALAMAMGWLVVSF